MKTGVTGPSSPDGLQDTLRAGKLRRQKALGEHWTQTVAELRRRGMVTKDSEVGYQDASETIGRALLHVCEVAVPVSPPWNPGKPTVLTRKGKDRKPDYD